MIAADPRNKPATRVAGGMDVIAGSAQALSEFYPGNGEAAYVCGTAWGAAAAINAAQTGYEIYQGNGNAGHALDLTSTALNGAASAASLYGTNQGSLVANGVSAGLWGAGAVASAGAAFLKQRYAGRPSPRDIEANYPDDPESAA
ncbi:MAG TPA: hypothetical protein VL689_06195 [Paraburkholderia sp.]|jgi:hypothetical protein|nr:hypothetical protein [Paraburkholderia sp.]